MSLPEFEGSLTLRLTGPLGRDGGEKNAFDHKHIETGEIMEGKGKPAIVFTDEVLAQLAEM